MATVDYSSDPPKACITNCECTNIIRSMIGSEIATLFKKELEGPVRTDKLLTLFQVATAEGGPFQMYVRRTAGLLHSAIKQWITEACEMYDSLWWEVAPTLAYGWVRAKVIQRSEGGFEIDSAGIYIEGLLGPWCVDDQGNGITRVGDDVVSFTVATLIKGGLLDFLRYV